MNQATQPNVQVKNKSYKTMDITKSYLVEKPAQAISDINDAYVAQVSVPAQTESEDTSSFESRIDDAKSALLDFVAMTNEFDKMNSFKGNLRSKQWDDGGVTLSVSQGEPKSFSLEDLRSALEATV